MASIVSTELPYDLFERVQREESLYALEFYKASFDQRVQNLNLSNNPFYQEEIQRFDRELKEKIYLTAKNWFEQHESEIRSSQIKASDRLYGELKDAQNTLGQIRNCGGEISNLYHQIEQLVEVVNNTFPESYLEGSLPHLILDVFAINSFGHPSLFVRIWRAACECFHHLCLSFCRGNEANWLKDLATMEFRLREAEEYYFDEESFIERHPSHRWADFLKEVSRFYARLHQRDETVRYFPEEPILDYHFHIHPQNRRAHHDRRNLGSKYWNYMQKLPSESDCSHVALATLRKDMDEQLPAMMCAIKDLRRSIRNTFYQTSISHMFLGPNLSELRSSVEAFARVYFLLIQSNPSLRELYPHMVR